MFTLLRFSLVLSSCVFVLNGPAACRAAQGGDKCDTRNLYALNGNFTECKSSNNSGRTGGYAENLLINDKNVSFLQQLHDDMPDNSKCIYTYIKLHLRRVRRNSINIIIATEK